MVHHEFLSQGRTVNKEYYIVAEMHRIVEIQLWILHRDNAQAHTSMLVWEFLAKNKSIIMSQPPYSPDLVPADFFLFQKLNTPIKEKCFAMIEEIKEKSKQELLVIPKIAFRILEKKLA